MRRTPISLLALLCAAGLAPAQTTRPWQAVGSDTLADWSGVVAGPDGGRVELPGAASFRVAAGPKGFFKHGFRLLSDSAFDWQATYGLRFDVTVAAKNPVELTVTLATAKQKGPDQVTTARVVLPGENGGRRTVTLPWSAFDLNGADRSPLKYVAGVTIAAKSAAGEGGAITLGGVRVVAASAVSLACDVRGRSVPAGGTAEYPVTVGNATDGPQVVTLGLAPYGWEVMHVTVEPPTLTLGAGEQRTITVRVTVPDRVAPGGHEDQVLQAVANGDADRTQRLTLVTTRQLPHPYVLHDAAAWRAVRDKVAKYDWAKAAADKIVKQASAWTVPDIAKPPRNDPDDTYGPFLFVTPNEAPLLACGMAWQLTGDNAAAEKVAAFLRRLSDPVAGYPKTLRAVNQSQVQEGHFFQHVAMAYDMVLDAGVLSDNDRKNIEATFRLFMGTIARELDRGAINNWNLSESCGAFYCALAMQDLAAADRFFAGPSGVREQLAVGTMDDGWWYECSISYNMWCASEFTQAALAYRAFGYDFLHERVPANYSPRVLLTSDLNGGTPADDADPAMRRKPFGMDPDTTGPNRRSYRTITDLWDSLLPFVNDRGVMFGVNDSTENLVTGYRSEVAAHPFELAYYAFGDPKYAAMVKLAPERDLLYGVPELPAKTPEQFRDNAVADNVGLALLRSQTPGRTPREQIQAVLHYGTHGWAHGHYDRTDLLSLMRYGRSVWNPESIWWGYEPFLYKFFVQTSINHNMVVVDGKMQEATPGRRLLLHAGKLMQATAVETTARWSHPPYGGMVYDYVPVKTFAEKQWREGRSVPEPATKPAYGTLTEFTEPVLQRRLMVVTDDYVVLADYVKGERPHTFDSLLQLRGFAGIDHAKPTGHAAQYDTDPRSSGQFITDCDWYTLAGPSLATFRQAYGSAVEQGGARTFGNDPGVLNVAVHTAWPATQNVMVATSPQAIETQKRLWYAVEGDGKTLTDGKFGSWLLGRGDVDVPVAGVKTLRLTTKTELAKLPTLLWVNAKVVTKDGHTVPLASLPIKTTNVRPAKGPNQDYSGGPVKIAGEQYADALAAEPQDAAQPAVIEVDLSGVDAVRLTASVGGDYPLGDEAATQKTFAVRQQGNEARFLTIIEPYEKAAIVQSVTADGPDAVTVTLADGRTQRVTIENFTGDGQDVGVNVTETKDGKTVRQESTTADHRAEEKPSP